MVISAEDYKKLLSSNGKYNASVELTCISHLFSNYFLKVHYENSSNSLKALFVICCFQDIMMHGFDVPQNNSHTLKAYNFKKY